MAYATRYLNIHTSLEGYTIRVQIEEDNYSGGVIDLTLEGENPVVITRTLKDNIITTGCKLNVVNDLSDLYEYANMHKDDERTYLLSIIRTYQGVDTTLLFKGYLIDDVFNQKLEKNASLILAFNDGLAHLDRYYPAFLESDDIYFTEQEVINQCIAFTYLDGNTLVNSTLYEDSMNGAEMLINPLLSVYLNRWTFTKSDGELETAEDILKKILKSYNAIIYQKEGHYYIERYIDRALASKTWWRYTPGSSDPHDSYVESGLSPINIDSHIIHRDSLNYTIIPAAKLLKLQLMYELFDNLIINEFIMAPTSAYFHRWFANTYVDVADTDFSNDFIFNGMFWRKESGTDEDYSDYASVLYNSKFTKDSSNETKLTYSFKFWRPEGSEKDLEFRFLMYIGDGTTFKWIARDYYDEEWALSDLPFEIKVEINTGNKGMSEFTISREMDLTGLLGAFDDHIDIKIYNKPVIIYGYAGGPYLGAAMHVGDFELKTNDPHPDNLIENDLNIAKNKIISDNLELFDTLSWNFINSKYRSNVNGKHLTEAWTDDTLTSLTLQDHYITGRCQFLNYVRNAFRFTIQKVKIGIDEIFTTTFLEDENSNDIKLIIETMVHNPKADTYDIKFMEYVPDVNKRIGLTP